MVSGSEPHRETVITVKDLTVAYGSFVVMRNLDFAVHRGEVFVIMGGSGCGKSTLMKVLVGLKSPEEGKVFYGGASFWDKSPDQRDSMMRNFGILYQSGALWSSMTLSENVALPLEQYTNLAPREIGELVSLKLSLVGLAGFEEYYPSELSGGMRKRAGLARAMALDPEILFFDEPGAGLDPVTSRLLDDLILEIQESIGSTIIMVTHELASIFAVGSNAIFLDTEARTITAYGSPKELLKDTDNPNVRRFLSRGEG